MAIYTIRTYPDPVLRKVAEKVLDISEEICRCSNDMVETMHAARGIGLAANQVGLSLRLIVVDVGAGKESKPLILVNPEIIELQSEEVAEEGCLSVPGFYEMVKRAQHAVVRGADLAGKECVIESNGLLARAFQHEIDHLNGLLFVDHLSPIKKRFFKKEFLKENK